MKSQEERIEEAYMRGHESAYNSILRECVKMLGYDSDLSKMLETQIVLANVKTKLIEICEALGDDADLTNLHPFDIADKHILPLVQSSQIQKKIKTTSTIKMNLFNFWKFMLNHPQARESDKYLKPIDQRIKQGYTAVQLAQAICGLSLSRHHIENGYTHSHYAFKDDKQVIMMINVAVKNGVTEEIAEKQFNWFIEKFNSGYDIKELINMKDAKIQKKSVNPRTGEELL